MTSLDLSGSVIRSLAGMEAFTFLVRVDVSDNHIEDFSPLAGIAGLEIVGESAQTAHVHEWGAWTEVRPCTDTDDGLHERVCALCGDVEQKELPAGTLYFEYAGTGATWTQGAAGSLSFTFKRSYEDEATFSHFAGVRVDGADVDRSDYDAKAGSVVVTLHASYLGKLAVGGHTIQALFDDGNNPTASFAVRERAASETAPAPAPAQPEAPSKGGPAPSQTETSDPQPENPRKNGTNLTEQPVVTGGSGAVSRKSAAGALGTKAAETPSPAHRAAIPRTGDPLNGVAPIALAATALVLASRKRS